MIIGTALGVYAYAFSPEAAYGLSVALLSLALLCISMISRVPQPLRDISRHPIRQMIDGMAYVRRNRMVLATITLDLFAVILAWATALHPGYARVLLHGWSAGFGLPGEAPAMGEDGRT